MKSKIVAILIFSTLRCEAQNLIYNGDFEICNGSSNCNLLPNNQSQFNYVDGWYGSNPTPDWFKDNGNHDVPNAVTNPYSCLGVNTPNAVNAQSGLSYAGMYDQEEITYDFGSNLPQGQYRLSFWARGCGDLVSVPWNTDNNYWGVSVFATPGPILRNVLSVNECSNINLFNKRIHRETFTNSNPTEWRKIEFIFDSRGENYRYLTITGLRDVWCGRYLFIDNVSMEDICCGDYMLYQSTESLPKLTQRKDYVWAGYDVGCENIPPGNVKVKSGQYVEFIAAAPQVFPGFTTELGAVFTMTPGNCSVNQPVLENYEIDLLDYTNLVFFACNSDPVYSAGFVAKNATYYKIKIFDNWGAKIFDKSGAINEQSVIYTNGSELSTCVLAELPVVQLQLYNCVTGATKTYTYTLYYEYLYSTHGCIPFGYCSCPSINCPNKTESDSITTNILSNRDIRIYPNPTSDFVEVSINIEDALNVTLKILNSVGEVVCQPKNYALENGSAIIPLKLENFIPGLYFVTISSSNQTNTQKLIIQP